MGPVLSFKRGVSREVRKALREFFRNVQGVVRFEHDLPVIVIPSDVVSVERNASYGGFGFYDNKPQIILGGTVSEKNTLAEILDSAAHEIGHYEQFRDGRELTERGVKVRARGILKSAEPKRKQARARRGNG
jgi:hypothetical protein